MNQCCSILQNLSEIMEPGDYNDGGSSLILVSTGARVLRIKKAHFMEKLPESAKEHAKHLALKQR